jgi:hypothetical protein
MKGFTLMTFAMVISATPAYAASGTSEFGLLMWMFLGFGALIVVMQMVPGMILFGVMLKGLFSRRVKEGADDSVRKT